jgi:hypothetical protein
MTDSGTLYSRIRDLPVVIDEVALDRLELPVSPEFTRVTTLVVLRGLGHEGIGEDVTYEADEAALFAITGPPDLRGEWTIHTLSQALESIDLFPVPPAWEPSRNYRRWAFESAALDLGLRQAGQSLHQRLDTCGVASLRVTHRATRIGAGVGGRARACNAHACV